MLVRSLAVGWVTRLHPFRRIRPRLSLSDAEILTKDIGPPTALIMQRIAGTDELPEAQSDEALAAVDRVILAISVERVSAMSHL